MTDSSPKRWRFIAAHEAEVERLPGKIHSWHCRPDLVPGANLMFVRAQLPPGEAHRFHCHPEMEEILYILSGQAEQWAEREHRILHPGDSFYVPAGVVHGTYNVSSEPLEFLAVLSPGNINGPVTVEVGDQEPWKSLKS